MRKGQAVAAGLLVVAVTAGCKTVVITPSGGYSPTAAPPQSHTPQRAEARPARTPAQAPPKRPRPTKPRKPARPAKHARGPAKTVLAQGSRGPRVRALQARLAQLSQFHRKPTGFYGRHTAASVSAFQRKYGLRRTGTLDKATWSTLRALTRPPTRAEMYPSTSRPVAAPDRRCLRGRVLCVSKRSNTLAWMVDGQVRSTMDVRFGAQYTPTREGTFRISLKSRRHVSSIYHTPMPYAMFFSGGQAVHFSPDFAARGYRGASHGCVNVRDKNKIAALFQQVRLGDKVVIYK
ncbi:L,D-transpeptidase family protein [Streptomyces albofaciens]|uniref:L,D-transpeptidase family protein n=1 Tax=Streptomyces albofaciens TaxID=66866 RepID=UPI001FCB64B5|nr:L,D-transpeptidase family protein [Streptomyces albofaciens]